MNLPSAADPAQRDGQPLTRRQLLRGIAAVALSETMPAAIMGQSPSAAWSSVAEAAVAFLKALTPDKRRQAMIPFDSRERFNWHYIPRRREGLTLKAMNESERAAAHQLLRSALSEVGYRKAVDIMQLEEVLRQIEFFPFSRDEENYAFTVFSTAGSPFPIGWRIEGHHLSLNFTVVSQAHGALTPAFMGANPAEVREGSRKGLRVLAQEQDLAFELVGRLNPEQRRKVVMATRSLGDIVSGPGRTAELKAPVGLSVGEMTSLQREGVMRLLEVYARNMRADVAEAQLRAIHEADTQKISFAWAGSLDAGQPHYYRLHGPTLLIEYDNTQNDANHIHSVWHELGNDFGEDLLRAHYETGHPHRQ
jgi:hypothetical protein